jgi:hypothetical protein
MKITYRIRGIITVLIMLTIAPFSAVIGMVLSDPELWESSMNLETLLVFSMFGIITVPLWITYLPMTILSPFIMKYFKQSRSVLFTPYSDIYRIVFDVRCNFRSSYDKPAIYPEF